MARKSLTLVSVGPVDHRIAERAEETVGVVVLKRVLWLQSKGSRACQRIGSEAGAGDFLLTIDAVRVGGKRVDAHVTVERDRERQQDLTLRPPRPLPRTVTVVSPPEATHRAR